MNSDTMFSSAKHDWQTPEEILDLVRQIAPIHFDPATTADNPTGAKFFRTPEDCGLSGPWPTDGLTYVNPPYGRILGSKWSKRICQHTGETVICLPARTDTKWFARFVDWADWIVLWKGRIKFKDASEGASEGAPFPSAFAYRGHRPGDFVRIFGPKGHLMPGTRTLKALVR